MPQLMSNRTGDLSDLRRPTARKRLHLKLTSKQSERNALLSPQQIPLVSRHCRERLWRRAAPRPPAGPQGSTRRREDPTRPPSGKEPVTPQKLPEKKGMLRIVSEFNRFGAERIRNKSYAQHRPTLPFNTARADIRQSDRMRRRGSTGRRRESGGQTTEGRTSTDAGGECVWTSHRSTCVSG